MGGYLDLSLKVLTTCWLTWFWIWSIRTLFPTVMPEIQLDMELSTSEAALILGAFNMSIGMGTYIFGVVGNKVSRRKLILYGLVLSISATLVSSLVAYYPAMLVTVTAVGLGFGAYLPNAIAILSEVFPPQKRGYALGLHESAAPSGKTIGSLLVWTGSAVLAWEGIISSWALFGLLPLVLVGAHIYDPKPAALVTEPSSGPNLRKWTRKQTFLLAVATSSALTGVGGFIYIMPIYMVNEFGLQVGFVAFILGVTSFAGVLGQVVGGRLSDKYGRRPVLLFITGAMTLATMMLSFLPFNPIFVGVLFIQYLTGSAFFPVTLATISDHTSTAERSGKIGFQLFVATVVGGGLTPVIIGFVAERVNYQLGFLFPIALTIAGVVSIYYLKFTSQQRHEAEQRPQKV